MYRHDADGVGVGVLVVLPSFRIVVFSAVLQEVGERAILLHRLGVKVNSLEVRYHLAELAQIVEDDLTATVGHAFLADTCVLEEAEEKTLDRIEAPALLVLLCQRSASTGRVCDGTAEPSRVEPQVRPLPGLLDCGLVDART